jgi:MFS family permease
MLYDSLVEENRKDEYAEVLGKTSSPTQSSAAVVGILGGFIAYYSFKLSFWLSVIPPILCILLSFFLIEPKKHSKESTNIYAHLKEAVIKFKNNKQLRLLSLANIFSYGSGEAAFQFQSAFYSTIWPVWALGIAKTLSNVGAAISFHFSGRLIKKFTPLKILFLTEFYDNIVNFIAVVFKSVLSPILMSSTSLLFGVTVVASNTLMQKEFSDQQRATMGSLNSFLGSIFFAVFAVLVGLIGDKFGPAYVYMFVILFQIIPTFLYWKLYSKER